MSYLKKATIKKHKMFDKEKIYRNDGFLYCGSIPWNHQKDYWWNESCAKVIEIFGLPGERFQSHPLMDRMDFYFKSEKDLFLFKMLFSEYI
jgi:hypothetical protein